MNSNLKIFLVDDDPFCISILKQHLNELGLTDIAVFKSGNEVLENLYQKPQIIFLDYNLEDINGSELLTKIKSYNPQISVIMISGQTEMEIAIKLLNSGAFDYIIKDENITLKISDNIYKILSILEYRKRSLNELDNTEKEKIVLDTQDRIKNEISSELHDNVNQLLAASKMYIESAKKDEKNRVELLDESKNILESAINEIRKLSHNLNTVFIKNVDLKKELMQLSTYLKTQHKFKFTSKIDLENIQYYLTPQKQHEIFRIIQEQVNNIIKYAKAKHVNIEAYLDEEDLILKIEDDGVGFNLEDATQGIGLTSIFKRINILQSQYSIKTAPGKGCKWKLIIPIPHIIQPVLLKAV